MHHLIIIQEKTSQIIYGTDAEHGCCCTEPDERDENRNYQIVVHVDDDGGNHSDPLRLPIRTEIFCEGRINRFFEGVIQANPGQGFKQPL